MFRSIYSTSLEAALRQIYDGPLVETQVQEIENSLVTLFNTMVSGDESAAQIHRYNIAPLKANWTTAKLSFTCVWCLRRCWKHPLSCGHRPCDSCVREYGEQCLGSDCEFIITQCIVCEGRPYLKARIKPPTAGVRLMSIDGGGIRGIIPLGNLSSVQEVLGEELPILNFFEFIIGTSSGPSPYSLLYASFPRADSLRQEEQ